MDKYHYNNVSNVILFVLLVLLQLFRLTFVDTKIVSYAIPLILIYLTFRSLRENFFYKKLILWYFFFIIVSCLYSAKFNHQHLLKVFIHSYDCWSVLFSLYIIRLKPTYRDVTHALICVCFIFSACYLLQWIIHPTVIFSAGLTKSVDRFAFRMRFPGSMCCYILVLYGLNKLVISKRLVYFLYMLAGFLPALIQGFRSLLALLVFSMVGVIVFCSKNIVKSVLWVLLFFLMGLGALQVDLVKSKLEDMIGRQESGDTFSNPDYVRWRALDYFDNLVFTDGLGRIVGNGIPVEDGQSEYGKKFGDARNRLYYYIQDLGIIGLSYLIGIPATSILVVMVLLCMHRCKADELQYIRFALFTVFAGSIMTSMELYREGNILILSLLLTIEYLYSKKVHSTVSGTKFSTKKKSSFRRFIRPSCV